MTDLEVILPADTLWAWRSVAPVLPPSAYLAGGTALACHLGHRVSLDLDLFLAEPPSEADLRGLADRLASLGPLVVTELSEGTLNCLLGATKIQFLDASRQHMLEPPSVIEAMPVAGLADLAATKLGAISSRAAWRDYLDLYCIETEAHLFVEEALALYIERFQPTVPEQNIETILRCLCYFEDVAPEPLPRLLGDRAITIDLLQRHWVSRVPEIARNCAVIPPN